MSAWAEYSVVSVALIGVARTKATIVALIL